MAVKIAMIGCGGRNRAHFQKLKLMEDIRDCEDKITYARNRYNMTVARFNMDIAMIPGSIVAGAMHLTPEEMFEITAAAREDADNMRIGKL